MDWGHDGVNVHCDADNEPPAQNNIINGNKISAQNSPYCRGFSTGGPEGKVQFNTFEDNIVKHTSARNQINGNNNIVRRNTIDTVTNNPFKSRAIGQGIHLQAYDNQVCHDNIIENNTIKATDDAAIYLYPGDGVKKNNIIRGNTIIDSGLAGGFGDSEQSPPGTAIYVGDSENVVNNIISDNVIRRTSDNMMLRTSDNMMLRTGDNSEEPALIYFRGRQLTVTEFNAEKGESGEDKIFDNIFLWGVEEMQALSAPKGLTIN
ncbi:hypothetical protein CKO36_00460 [Rhabdochromatium marinum]|nr:hypothetical protein [Rhabdochromatium marinum]